MILMRKSSQKYRLKITETKISKIIYSLMHECHLHMHIYYNSHSQIKMDINEVKRVFDSFYSRYKSQGMYIYVKDNN